MQFNGPLFVLAKAIKMVMALASEAEDAEIFINAQELIPVQQCLEQLLHPQPTPPSKQTTAQHKALLTAPSNREGQKPWIRDFTG